MAKIGSFVTDPKVGAYCQIKLDDGKILLVHDKASMTSGTITITEVKWLGLGEGQTLLTCALESPQGQATLSQLTQGARPGSVQTTPFGAFVELLKDCRTMSDVRDRCTQLTPPERSVRSA